MIFDSTQKAGDNSEQYLAENGGVINVDKSQKLILTNPPEETCAMIQEIFDFLFSKLNDLSVEPTDNDGKLIHLSEKVPLNFDGGNLETVESDLKNIFPTLLLVGEYIETKMGDTSSKVLSVKMMMQCEFRRVLGVDSHFSEIKSADCIHQMAEASLPESRKKDSGFKFVALAIAYYFFERCDFGRKTPRESAQQNFF